jgi:hypothetical protein
VHQEELSLVDYVHCQDAFSKGELSPTMYARVTTTVYYKGMKKAKNILPIPQGGARKRWGTLFSAVLAQTNYQQIRSMVFEYLSEAVYVIIFYNNAIDIYLEGRLIATVAATGILTEDLPLMDWSVIENKLRVTTGIYKPKDLTRSASAANIIAAVDTVNDYIQLTTATTSGFILPIRFTTAGTLPTTTPQIKTDRTYFFRAFSANNVRIYSNVEDAANDVNRYDITAAGAGVSNVVPLNTWTFADVAFKFYPVHDFSGGYDAITFTPGATTGATTLTASGAIFNAGHVGGLFFSLDGGIARITAFTDTTHVNIQVVFPFVATTAVSGAFCTLTEPAWSNARGWPRLCSSYQNRAFFANTELLTNGLWGSTINDFEDFDDSLTDDDNAISWFPTSDIGNEINFITPFKSLVVHTESGVYSTPMGSDTAITPRNFSLTLQDNTPTAEIQPVVIDNQVIVLSGVDVHSLLYDLVQSGYTPNIVSAISEHLIIDPIDMQAFRDRRTSGGRYVFFVNSDGSLAMYQTLYSEEVSGWTPAYTEQYYGNAYFRKVLSSVTGRCWFIVERQIAEDQAPIAITDFDAGNDTLEAIASSFSTTQATAVLFTTTGTLPETVPQILTTKYYFAIGIDANNFKIYQNIEDAENDVNPIEIVDAGVNSNVVPYTLTTKLILEELSYDVFTDCTIKQEGSGLTNLTGLDIFDGQLITVKADGRRFDSNPVIGGVEAVTAMGVSTPVDSAETGFKINYEFWPMPISVSLGANINTSNLAQPKHIRYVNAIFTDTIGGKINNQNIALSNISNFSFDPPVGQTGIFQVSVMSGWNQDFSIPAFKITHDEPFPFTLIGLFYGVDV